MKGIYGWLDAVPALVRYAPWVARWMILCVVVVILGFGLIDAWSEMRELTRDFPGRRLQLTTGVAAAFVFVSAWWMVRKPRPFSPLAFVAISSIAAAYVRYFYSVAVEPEWTSDFLFYWNIAQYQVESGDFRATDLYTERTLPVLVPLIQWFGPEKGNVVLANIGMLGMIQLAGYDLLRRAHSHQAAQAFTLVFVAAPIPVFALTIPSHDLWAMWYCALALWICAVVLTSRSRAFGVAMCASVAGLAILCLLMEIQRGVGLLLAGTLALTALLGWMATAGRGTPEAPTGPRRLLLVCLVVLAAQAPLGWLASHLELRAAEDPGHKAHLSAYYAANGTSLGDGSWGWLRDFGNDFTNEMRDNDPERLAAFSSSLVLSDWAMQPVKRIQNVRERMGRLFVLDNSNVWYFAGLPTAQDKPIQWLRLYSLHYSTAFALLIGFALARMLLGTLPSTPVLAGLVLTAVTALILSSFSENQPRYLLWFWLTGSLFLAEMGGRRIVQQTLDVRAAGMLALAVPVGWLILLLLLWLPTVVFYGANNGRIIGNWTYSQSGDAVPGFAPLTDEGTHTRTAGPGRLAFVVRPGDENTVETRLCPERSSRQGLTFFLRTHHLSSRASLTVQFGDGAPERIEVGSEATSPRDIRITGLFGTAECGILRLGVESEASRDDARVEIHFPRLER